MTELRSNWNYPTAVRFGAGRITELADACRALGMTKPLLVTDPGIAGLPMVADAVLANDDAGLPTGLYADVKPNPLGSNVDDGLAVYRDGVEVARVEIELDRDGVTVLRL